MNDNRCSCESTDCGSSCSSGNCASRPQDFIEKTHELNSIKRVIGVVSGKGGVGKSLVTSTLAVMMRRKGYNVDEAINAYLNGSLKSSDVGCTGHEHSHEHSHGESGCNCGHH